MAVQSQASATADTSELIQGLFASSSEYAFIGLDADGSIIFWNEGARRLYGYGADDIVRKATLAVLHPKAAVDDSELRSVLAAASEKGVWEGTLDQLRRGGVRFTARVTINARRDRENNTSGYLYIAKDISAELRSAEELRANEFYTRSLIESNIDALMTTDPLGIITDVNKQMGRSPAERATS